MNPLNSILGAIITGLILMVIIALALPGGFMLPSLERWLHVIAGVMWVGLLYYFNVVQIPGLAAAGADKGGPGGAGVTKYIAPRALLWFRWAAVVTALSGIALIESYRPAGGGLVQVLSFQANFVTIGIGSWLGHPAQAITAQFADCLPPTSAAATPAPETSPTESPH